MSKPKGVSHTIRVTFVINLTEGNHVDSAEAIWFKGIHEMIACHLKSDNEVSWWEAVGRVLFQLAEARDSYLMDEILMLSDQGETTLVYSADAGGELG